MNRLNAFLFVAFSGVIAAAVSIRGTETVEDEEQHCAGDSLGTLTTAEADFRGCDRDWDSVVPGVPEHDTRALPAAEPDFRANDRDWCGGGNFWTSDGKGLYTMTSASAEARKTEALRGLTAGYWDGIGLWHGDLWILDRLVADRVDPAIRLIELSVESADALEK